MYLAIFTGCVQHENIKSFICYRWLEKVKDAKLELEKLYNDKSLSRQDDLFECQVFNQKDELIKVYRLDDYEVLNIRDISKYYIN